MTTEPVLPEGLRTHVDRLRSATGHEPEVAHLGGQRWRLTMRNDRVLMTVEYKIYSRGRRRWLRSTLVVDGQERELAVDFGDFCRIFLDPDSERVPDQLPPLPPAAVEDAPVLIRQAHQQVAERLSPELYEVGVGHDGREWALDVRTKDHSRWVRVSYRLSHSIPQMSVEVVVDGVDRTREVRNDLSRAMALLSGSGLPTTSTAPPAVSAPETRGRGYGSVDQRRSAVIRT